MKRLDFIKLIGIGAGIISNDISVLEPVSKVVENIPTVYIRYGFPNTAEDELIRNLSQYISEEIDAEIINLLKQHI